MIEGFEEFTYELTDEEKEIAEKLAHVLSRKVGKEKAITSKDIIIGFKQYYETQLTGARVRKLINYIRLNFLLKNLVATSRGYYIETDQKEVDKYVESLLQRADAIRAVANSYKLKIQPKYAAKI